MAKSANASNTVLFKWNITSNLPGCEIIILVSPQPSPQLSYSLMTLSNSMVSLLFEGHENAIDGSAVGVVSTILDIGKLVGDTVGDLVAHSFSVAVELGLNIFPASRCGSIIAALNIDTSTMVSHVRA